MTHSKLFALASLIAVGLLMVTGWWDVIVADLRSWVFPGFEAGV